MEKLPSSLNEFLTQLTEAVAQMEGFYITENEAKQRRIAWPTAAQRNNNPGNLMDLDYFRRTEKFKLMSFPSVEIGFKAAMSWWLRRYNENVTLRQALHRYAPKGHGDNHPDRYTEFVSNKLKINPDVPLQEALLAKSSK